MVVTLPITLSEELWESLFTLLFSSHFMDENTSVFLADTF